MKVLLVGDYSSAHLNLYRGLMRNGISCDIVTSGDSWKKIDGNITVNSSYSGFVGKVISAIKPFYMLSKKEINNYDVIQFVNPCFLYGSAKYSRMLFNAKFKQHPNKFIMACGDCSIFWAASKKELTYGPFDDWLKFDLQRQTCNWQSDEYIEYCNYFYENMKAIIPVMHEYDVGLRNSYHSEKVLTPVPLMVCETTLTPPSQTRYQDNKLVVFHGLNRPGFKGSHYIKPAFDIVRSEAIGSKFKFVIDGKLPLAQYLELLNSASVVVDQANSYSLGMNGVYSLGLGQKVLGGAEPESLAMLNELKSPIVNIKPDIEDIAQRLRETLSEMTPEKTINEDSLEFFYKHHEAKKNSLLFLERWMQ
ncbi:hypothetical protein [Pseudomonas sp.]|uniref:hypothetical protein n=1 Tax=Pseudomonas sp. TaxID=306 RepID=UPI003FD758CE